ncbi:MAG: AlpA family transcriptional regulator [Alphaproteobacteria bacterium]|nr:AlpA family transcriptional regulator [Alphaproteobacteria bacterium]
MPDNNHTNFPHPSQFLSAKELEKFTGMTRRFWESRRITGDTPPFVRISPRAVRYRWSDVQEWLEKRLRTSTSDQRGE